VGIPYQEIANTAEILKTDLIVIATHGRTGLAHVLLGSTTEHLVRHAPCPVLVVREKERECRSA
jgi:nucleotide-binding universal stress UspA family protein